MNELLIFGIIMLWVIIAEYILLDFYYFRREMKLRHELFEDHMEDLETIFQMIDKHADGMKVNVEKRITCPSCGYPMRVLSETDEYYECYCAGCKMDRWIDKRK